MRRVLLEFAKPRDFSNYPQDYIEQMRMQGLTMAAQQLVKSGYAAEAVPIFSESLAIAEAMGERSAELHRQPRGSPQAGQRGPDRHPGGTRRRPARQDLAGSDPAPAGGGRERGDERGHRGGRTRDQAVDLVLLIHPTGTGQVGRQEPLRRVGRGLRRVPDELATVTETLGGLRERQPDDLSVGIAAALAALAGKDRERSREALEALDRLVTAKPLEPLADGARANARQRAEAARLLPLWVVARACWDDESAREFGDRFSELALEAAGRQSDNRWTMAMLRERGQYCARTRRSGGRRGRLGLDARPDHRPRVGATRRRRAPREPRRPSPCPGGIRPVEAHPWRSRRSAGSLTRLPRVCPRGHAKRHPARPRPRPGAAQPVPPTCRS